MPKKTINREIVVCNNGADKVNRARLRTTAGCSSSPLGQVWRVLCGCGITGSVQRIHARVAKLVDALDLGSSVEIRKGSTPFSCTITGSSFSLVLFPTTAVRRPHR